MFTKIMSTAAVGMLAIGLAGCSTTLTTEQTAKQYLDLVCPINIETTVLNNEVKADIDAGDLAGVTKVSAELRDLYTVNAAKLGSDSLTWPADVKALMTKASADYSALAGYWDEKSKATTLEEANAVEVPELYKTSGSEIRTILGLSTDTAETCAPYETK